MSPLTEQHFQAIEQGLALAKIAEQEIERAKRAGIDVAQHEERLKKATDQLQRVRQVYFSDRG